MHPFVGRQPELTALDALLEASAPGVTSVEVVGDPGIGKSRLLFETVSRAAARGFTVLSGRAGEFEQDQPFGMFLDALEDRLAELSEEEVTALGVRHLRALATLFPALADWRSAEPPPGGRRALYRAVTAALETTSGPCGTVLALDDLHWADEASAELLAHLLRRPPAGPLVLLLAHRHRQLPDKVAAVLHEPVPVAARRIELQPLDFAAAQHLMADTPHLHQRRARHRAAGGNPLYLQLMARGGQSQTAGDLTGALLAEFTRLSPAARLVAQAAAVLGDQVEPGLVAVAADLPAAVALAAAEELFATDLLRAAGAGQRVTFRHPLLRNAVYHSATPLWRAAAHGRVGRALSDRGAPISVIAPHVARSAVVGDAEALRLLRAAALDALVHAPATAASWLRAALELHAEPHDRLGQELRVELAHALVLTGNGAETREVTTRLLQTLPTDQAELRLRVTALHATASRFLVWPAETKAVLQVELRRLSDRDELAAAGIWLRIANLEFVEARFEAAAAAAGEVLRHRPTGPDCPVRCAGLAMLAWCYPELGRAAESVRLLDEATELFDRITSTQHNASFGVANLVPFVEVIGHLRLDSGLPRLRQVLRQAEEFGHVHFSTELLAVLAAAEAARGQLATAVDMAEEAVDGARLTGAGPLLVSALASQAAVAFDCLDLDVIERVHREVRAVPGSARSPHSGFMALSWALSRRQAGLDGDLAEAIDQAGGPELSRMLYRGRLRLYAELAELAAAEGQPAEAGEWAERAAELAEDALPWSGAFAALASAHAHQCAQRPGSALPRAEFAVRAFTTAGLPLLAARARTAAALAYAALGERGRALSELDSAAAGFAECGATRHIELVTRQQRKLGRRVTVAGPRTAKHSPLGLTRRESEIAALVAQGNRNRAIAERLVLSGRTVETHLGRIYQKLGVSSRTALAALLTQQPKTSPVSPTTAPPAAEA
ncbi:AAA family ATPase [Crossiella sp. NPDC003009]